MTRLWKGAVFLIILLGGVAAWSAAAAQSAGIGEQDYRLRCAACHGENGRGDGPIGYYFTAPPPDLTRIAARADGVFPRDAVAAIIDGRDARRAHGGRAMPVWGDFFRAEALSSLEGFEGDPEAIVAERLENLVDYIETLQR